MTSKNRKVVVIGGTSGIGLGAAQLLDKEGYSVVSTGRRELKIDGIEFHKMDVTSEDSVKSFFDQCSDFDYIVYCAGITEAARSIEEFDVQKHNQIIATNLTGLLVVLKYAVFTLRKRKGSVVVVNSVASRSFSKFSSVDYTCSKYALRGLVNQLSQDLAGSGVRINAVYPSMTRTPMLEDVLGKSKIKDIELELPLGRIAEVEDVSNAIEYLISDRSSYVTGTGIDVNGGFFPNA